MTGCSTLVEIDGNDSIFAVTFTANGKHLVSGGKKGVGVWRVEDGAQVVRMETPYALCVAASKDGRWIAAGTLLGEVIVWDAERYFKTILTFKEGRDINSVDFSPDSTRLLFASYN